ncbi:MAG TPA: hypothetical protein VKD28_10150 [Gemmatimonadales bacterium]|nr:hypothetical protein [Gemmatimonadales bacterium]
MRFLTLVAAIVLAACSSSNAKRGTSPTPSTDSDVITAEELAKTRGSTLYDAVRQLRPNWEMRARPTAVMGQNQAQLIVYVDGSRYGGFASLRTLKWSSAAYIRYYSPGGAEAQFGPGHLLGAIEVRTLPN